MNLRHTARKSFWLILILIGAFGFTSCWSEEPENEIDRLNKRIMELEEKNATLEDKYQDIRRRVDFLEDDMQNLVSPVERYERKPHFQNDTVYYFSKP